MPRDGRKSGGASAPPAPPSLAPMLICMCRIKFCSTLFTKIFVNYFHEKRYN